MMPSNPSQRTSGVGAGSIRRESNTSDPIAIWSETMQLFSGEGVQKLHCFASGDQETGAIGRERRSVQVTRLQLKDMLAQFLPVIAIPYSDSVILGGEVISTFRRERL